MSETVTETIEKPATPAVRGTHHKFLPLPVMPHHAKWFDLGPVALALEIRTIGDGKGGPGDRSVSLHVFSPDREREVLRFDCFDRFAHYHYILNDAQENIVWGYDIDANGPMLDWSFAAIRNRLPAFLRRAGEAGLAERAEREGLDTAALDNVRQVIDAWESAPASEEFKAETKAWYWKWKKAHPQFNTAAGEELITSTH